MSLFSTIIFDLGNVIVDLDINKTEECLSSLFEREDLYSDPEIISIIHKYETGHISEALFINKLLANAPNHKIQAKDILDCWNAMLLGISRDKIDLINELKKHYKIYILSNTNITHISFLNHWLEKNHGLINWFDNAFDAVFYSHEIGFKKPEVEAYNYVIDHIPDDKNNMLFVDDLSENVSAARRAGIHAFVYDGKLDLAEWLWIHHVNCSL